jgi:hypothetical protein
MIRRLACLVVLLPSAVAAQFQTVETSTMRMIYTSPLQSYLVPLVNASFENALRFHRDLFGYTPSGPINILMHDLWHYGNAGARPVPENHVTIGIAPYGHDYESAPAPERMASSMNHELAHIVTTDKATAADRFYRSMFFGKVTPNSEVPLSMLYSYLTTPRWYAPRWYLEGIATFLETWMAGGLGRAIGPYDEMVFRTLVRDSLRIYDVTGLESEGTTIDFQVGTNSYLYGTRFISYLTLRYGTDSLLKWVDRRPGSHGYFATQFRSVYGRSLEEEWSRWIDWEREWQRANLAAIRQHPTTVARPLTDRVLGSVSRAYLDTATGSVIVAVRYPGQEAHIAAIALDARKYSRLADIVAASGLSVTSLVFDPASRTIFYTTNNSDWRNLVALDLTTGHTRTLIKNARIGDLAFNPVDRSLWGVRHDDGFSTVVRVPYPYTEWKQVVTLPYGRDMFDLDVSPDGSTLIGSMSEVSGDQRLVRYAIPSETADPRLSTTPDVLFEFGEWSPSNFVFSRDGRFLFGTSYYSGVSNVFRYDIARRKMQPLSNAETGFFKPLPISGDSLVVFAYSGTGFVPSMIANTPPDSVSAIRFLGNEIAERRTAVQSWTPKALPAISNDSIARLTGTYSARRNLRLDSAYPVVEGYEDAAGHYAVAGGIRLNFSDRLGATGLDVTTSWSPGQQLDQGEEFHARAVFHHWNWKLTGAVNPADFYDLVGPTKTSRRGYSLAAQYKRDLLNDGPTTFGYTLQAAGYRNLATVPEFQNVAASFDKLASFSGDLAYRSLRKSLGAIDDELGATWDGGVRGNYVNGVMHPRLSANISRGFLLPLDHSSIWLRAGGGTALGGNQNDPFARFYFGGFANNRLDHREIKQFRNPESFPGLEINQVGGAAFGRAQAEWMSPPLRFRSVGWPSAYLRWASLSVFGTGLVTDPTHEADRRTFGSAGAQVDCRLVTLSHLDSTLSFGYAAAGGESVPTRSAFMVSFKIM